MKYNILGEEERECKDFSFTIHRFHLVFGLASCHFHPSSLMIMKAVYEFWFPV